MGLESICTKMVKWDIVYIKTSGQTKCVKYSFGLHIPHETNGYAFSLKLYENNTIELFLSHHRC